MRQITPVNHLLVFSKKHKHVIIFIPYISQFYESTGDYFKPQLQTKLLTSGHFKTEKFPESEYTFSIYFNNKVIGNSQKVVFI
jgi:hypothetical protein